MSLLFIEWISTTSLLTVQRRSPRYVNWRSQVTARPFAKSFRFCSSIRAAVLRSSDMTIVVNQRRYEVSISSSGLPT
jgi:hypothetical protein